MAYALTVDVEIAAGGPEQLVQLADFDRDGVADAVVLEAAMTRADALINSYAGGRYRIPFVDPVPRDIAARAAELTIYYLKHQTRSLTDDDRRDHELAVTWLKDLAAGTVVPGADPLPEEASSSIPGTVDVNGVARLGLRGFW